MELITAIGVLTILATVGLIAVNPLEQFKKSADAKRKADLAQIQRALEVYYQDYGRYPEEGANNTICSGDPCTVVAWGTDWRPYMDVLPIDNNSSLNYAYWTDSTGQSYALYASLEREGRDPQACNGGSACTNAALNNIDCGGVCNFGVTSPNIAP